MANQTYTSTPAPVTFISTLNQEVEKELKREGRLAQRPFWTVRNGQVGTAHLNRNGAEVDFRPARVEVELARKAGGDYEWRYGATDEETAANIAAVLWIVFTPGKGVGLYPVRAQPREVEYEISPVNDRGDRYFTATARADALGVAVETNLALHPWCWAKLEFSVVFEATEKAAVRAAAEARRVSERAEADRKAAEAFRVAHPEVAKLTPGQARRLAAPVWDLLARDGGRGLREAKQAQQRLLNRLTPVNCTWPPRAMVQSRIRELLPDWAKDPAQLRERLLAQRHKQA